MAGRRRRHLDRFDAPWVVLYVLGIAAGVASLMWFPPAIDEAMPRWACIMWVIMLLMSSMACLYSVLRRRWLGEYAGIPALFATVLVYAGAAFHVAILHGDGRRWPAAFIISMLVSALAGRWVRVFHDRQLAELVASTGEQPRIRD